MKTYTQLARHSGNEILFDVVEMGILACLWDTSLHIHVEGLRGTGKTTILRAAQRILPPINRIKGCLYNCHPEYPHCPEHRNLSQAEVAAIGVETIPRPFLEISHSAKIGTVAGSIDLAKITDASNPLAALLPGIIPQAHRGIIFIDEINRLADTSPEITDVLLDLMGTKPGRVQIEETGLPLVELPVQVSVWAASNPDEEPGPLQEVRRQLSDRFDFVVDMGRAHDADAISSILAQSEQARQNLWSRNFMNNYLIPEEDVQLSQRLTQVAEKYRQLQTPEYLRNYIARMYVKHGLESLRAIEAIQLGALLSTALRQGDKVLISDVLKVIPLALQHRVDPMTLSKIVSASDQGMGRQLAVGRKEDNNSFSGTSAEQQPDSSVPSKSLLSPLKNLLNGKTSTAPKKNKGGTVDEITASPPDKAKRVVQLRPEELIKSEEDFNFNA